MEPYWEVIRKIIEESDLVLEVLDARLVELSRNEQVESLIKEIDRPVIFVVNKSDLVSKSRIKKQIQNLKEKGEVIFISTKKKDYRLLYTIKKVFKKYGKRKLVEKDKFAPKTKHREAKGDIVVGVLGYPNVGKSSIINMLAHRKKVKVSKKAGTTHGIHWINAGDIRLIDSPGVIPLKDDDEIRYGLIGARTDKIKNPELVSHAIIKLFLKNNKKEFERFYKIRIKKEDPDLILEQVAEKKAFLKKEGKFDVNRSSFLIVRDWQQGRLRL